MSSKTPQTTSPLPIKDGRRMRRTPSSSTQPATEETGGVPLYPLELSPEQPTSIKPTRRRRPRKLAKSVPVPVSGAAGEEEKERDITSGIISSEVEALKNKVREIEEQVKEILLRPPPPAGLGKSARRRQRGTKKGKGEGEGEGKGGKEGEEQLRREEGDELRRLQEELEDAQRELVVLKGKKEDEDAEEEEVEEIPRLDGPPSGVQQVQRPGTMGRAVTLSGNYRIPLPVNVSDTELDAIGKGIRSAQNIARTFLESDRYQRRERKEGGSSWSEWFGGYSMSIARAVGSVQLVSTLETQPKRPVLQERADTEPLRRRPVKLERRSKRPEMERTLSETEMKGLLA